MIQIVIQDVSIFESLSFSPNRAEIGGTKRAHSSDPV